MSHSPNLKDPGVKDPGVKDPEGQIQEIVQDREKTHGSFRNNARTYRELHQTLLSALDRNAVETPGPEYKALSMICAKLSRITASPEGMRNPDNWLDIAGYCVLVLREIQGRPQGQTPQGQTAGEVNPS